MKKLPKRRKHGKKSFTLIAIAVFVLVAIMHLLRLILGWEVTLAGLAVPMWISALGLVVAVGLALMVWREMHR